MNNGHSVMDDVGPTGIWAGITSVTTVLASTVAYLYRALESKNSQAIADVKSDVSAMKHELEKCESKHDECLKDRDFIRVELATLKGELNYVRSQQK